MNASGTPPSPEVTLEKVRRLAEKNLRHCPYCIQHNEDFRARVGHRMAGVFASSPAFRDEGKRWYHLQLCNPDPRSRSGFGWVDCDEHEHHEYLAILNDFVPTLADAVAWVEQWDAANLKEK